MLLVSCMVVVQRRRVVTGDLDDDSVSILHLVTLRPMPNTLVLQVHMAAGDHAGLLEACMRLGDASRGGDPQLWNEVLEYLASQTEDVTQQVSR